MKEYITAIANTLGQMEIPPTENNVTKLFSVYQALAKVYQYIEEKENEPENHDE